MIDEVLNAIELNDIAEGVNGSMLDDIWRSYQQAGLRFDELIVKRNEANSDDNYDSVQDPGPFTIEASRMMLVGMASVMLKLGFTRLQLRTVYDGI